LSYFDVGSSIYSEASAVGLNGTPAAADQIEDKHYQSDNEQQVN
jgi:hypothetical protein